MMIFKRCFLLSAMLVSLPFFLTATAQAEERVKSKAEEMIPIPEKSKINLNTKRRAKLTEEQAISQLKFMMVKGWARMEKDLLENGTFQPFGLVLSPQGEFKPLFIDSGDVKVPSEAALGAVAQNLRAIAQTRAMWAVGLMYIQAQKRKDGGYDQRIQVMTEHIAGWARHWSYPFKVENGEVKLGAPIETPVKPIYFVKK